MKIIKVAFISDFICPWCYIGKVRLEKIRTALSKEINLDIDVQPFLLYPHIPIGGLPKSAFANRTKPGMGRSLRHEAKSEGIEINYKLIEKIPNSLKAHRLIWLISDRTLKYNLSLKIFRSYFESGLNIEDESLLLELGRQTGVAESVLDQFKYSDDGFDDVASQIRKTKEAFITIVPSIKLEDKFLIPGLQSSEVWEKYIRRAVQIKNAAIQK